MLFKKKCEICKVRDKKENLEHVEYGIYYHQIFYFHPMCVETVICDPENYTTRTVDMALWCHDLFLGEKKAASRKLEKQKQRINNAQESLECLQ